MTHRVKGEDGYYLLMLTPPSAGEMEAVARDVTFVVDVSGSMSGAKIKQARRALKFCLDRLQPDDHFGPSPSPPGSRTSPRASARRRRSGGRRG